MTTVTNFWAYLFSGYGEHDGDNSGFTYQHGSESFPLMTSWSLNFRTGTGGLWTDDDGAIAGSGLYDGMFYYWWVPESAISFTNVRILPTPLPASALLLGAGLLPLALLRRRKLWPIGTNR